MKKHLIISITLDRCKNYDYILKESGKHFDPNLVDVFLDIQEDLLKTKAYWNSLEARGIMPSVASFLPDEQY